MFNSQHLEYYALLTIEHLFPNSKKIYKLADKPDLQNIRDSIGIEVTSSAPENYRQNERYGEKLLGAKIAPIINKIQSFNGKVKIYDNRVFAIQAFTDNKLKLFERNYVKEIDEILMKKSKKIKSYQHFKTNGLYIFTFTSLLNKDEIGRIAQLKSIHSFDFIILNCINKIYIIQNGVIRQYQFTDEELINFYHKSVNNVFQ